LPPSIQSSLAWSLYFKMQTSAPGALRAFIHLKHRSQEIYLFREV
jgi:hypothetical protein